MSLDAYSLCPGGTGKKIKFCCGEFLAELQKIDRMVEGEQYLACLKLIDTLLELEPGRDRPCLLATKCMLLRTTDQRAAAEAATTAFLAKHPDNQIALAERALLVAERDARQAMGLLQRAIRAAGGNVSGRVYEAIGLTAAAMLREGFPLSARALLELQCELVEQDPRSLELLAALSRAADVPLLLRDSRPSVPCPEDAPWKDRFHAALDPIERADWQTGAERLTALAADVPDAPAVWCNLATLRGWLADNPGCIDALHRYAALRAREAGGLEDAVEAEATAMLLTDDPLGDRLEMFRLEWTIKDVERAQEGFLSAPRFRAIPFDPAQFSDAQTPPPKAAYMLLDRPMPESAEGLSVETAPRLLGQAVLFGRQTDREARLEVIGVAGDEVQAVKEMVSQAAGDAVEPQPKEEVVGHWSASQKMMRAAWQPPRGTSADQIRALLRQYQRETILNRWPDVRLGVLAGRSPREVAGEEDYRVRLLAAILVLEYWSDRLQGEIDFNELRAQLGLPVLEAIDPRQQPVDQLPTVRLSRVSVEGLSDDELRLAYGRAGAMGVRAALRKFAEAIVDRPSLADSNERLHAYATLAHNETDVARALEYVDKGRRAAEAKKQSSASWDMMELSLHFAARDGHGIGRLIDHLQHHHVNEPGVAEALTQMLIDVGMLRPDGTPAFAPEAATAAAEPPAAEPGGLWTPDSAQPTAGGGKLWTPG
jgi:hypothetical protein